MLDIAPPLLSPLAEPSLERAEALRLATSPDFLTLMLRAGAAVMRRFGRDRDCLTTTLVTCGPDAAMTFAGEPLPELQRGPRIPTVTEIMRRPPAIATQEWHILSGADAGQPFAAYERAVSDVRRIAPASVIVGFTATDIWLFSAVYHLPTSEILHRLHDAGLTMLSGRDLGLSANVTHGRSLDEWFALHRAAHLVGLRTAALVPYDAQGTWKDTVDYLLRLRDLHAATSGVARIALAPNYGRGAAVDALAQLRILALSRLICPATPHIIADCHTLGEQNALTALTCGADALAGTPEAVAAAEARFAEIDLRSANR